MSAATFPAASASRSFTMRWAPSAARRREIAAPRPPTGTRDEGDASVHAGIVGWGSDARSRRRDVAGALACAHGPERHHVCAAALHPSLPLVALRAGRPCVGGLAARPRSARPTGSTATSRATRPGAASSARSSTRPPIVCCLHRLRSARSSSTGRCPRGSRVAVLVREIVVGGALALLTLFGHEAHSTSRGSGKAGTLALMFSLPAFLLAASDSSCGTTRFMVGAWVFGVRPASCSGTTPQCTYVPDGPPGAPRRASSPTAGASREVGT